MRGAAAASLIPPWTLPLLSMRLRPPTQVAAGQRRATLARTRRATASMSKKITNTRDHVRTFASAAAAAFFLFAATR